MVDTHRRKKRLLSPHTIFRWRSQICGQREIPEIVEEGATKKTLGKTLARDTRVQSGQFSVARPHIRGEHGILMIAFGVNFRSGLYREAARNVC